MNTDFILIFVLRVPIITIWPWNELYLQKMFFFFLQLHQKLGIAVAAFDLWLRGPGSAAYQGALIVMGAKKLVTLQ